MLAAVVAVLAASAGVATVGLWRLAAFMERAPETIVVGRDALEGALEEAPFAAAGGVEAGFGPPVWVLASVDCGGCPEALDVVLDGLEAQDFGVRLLIEPSRDGQDGGHGGLIAALGRTGDIGVYRDWRAGRPLPDVISEPAEADGYEEWARQSAERLRAVLLANEIPPGPLILVWRGRADWRAAVSPPAQGLGWVGRDLDPSV